MPHSQMHNEAQPTKKVRALPSTVKPAQDIQTPSFDLVIQEFSKHVPGFIDFDHANSEDIAWYREHHHEGLLKAQQYLQELKTEVPQDEFPALLSKFLSSIKWYFDWREVMHWRDTASHKGFAATATEFFRALPLTTHADYDHYSNFFADEFGKGFAEVNYFLLFCHFVADPSAYTAMKLTRLAKVFKQMGINMKLTGHLLSFEEFNAINTITRQLFKVMAKFHPADMADVQIVMHYCGGESWK